MHGLLNQTSTLKIFHTAPVGFTIMIFVFQLMATPIGHKRGMPRLLPSQEESPEGSYIGQHSQGLGGHYAESYLKRRRLDTISLT